MPGLAQARQAGRLGHEAAAAMRGTSSSSARPGVIPSVEPVADDDPHMSAYLAWLKQHRGATDETIRRYRTDIRRLMPMLGEPSQWDAAGLRRAFQRRSKETPGSASLLVTIMRSYIRFLVVRGECRHCCTQFHQCSATAFRRCRATSTRQRSRGSSACPTDRPVEVRDKAIILLLARLGLRPVIFRTCTSTTSTGGPAT
jgi:site-specific recombinase XerC